ncbi:branched-chain amino acid ABC transporter substrate-binding protein [Mesorhizobium sp. M4B.F.Ca.ET.215.01.1.1]|uniref:ABC transporter substrate-binding protein n=1 Tax=Mesorhizobium abyssinicae TaxID=1209958 RepID=A0ABU5ANJ3_9HYPH|nr:MULTISPECIES: ABC transporter substrate-binding protein [Mesorhizobium]RVC60174.1 branched-chain amino acid ABC transporter substrate-binding protein [Mesorhizobium sp. M4B.F.Ca.ET.088.02.2.1]MDX8538872.1 ABC transporter substrate-binding protein [Mesorhizobium abyssinicae]RUW23003.1 branched-chain amino acid ABC transporter substrate-binding protein [Mesorhizobium sp. M4B.F.Ca.ET.013.02.1.1]RUW74469.1 branched-chain amino acid ABC transporter substrate-binding protein [Mesorhizobium sp. M4B
MKKLGILSAAALGLMMSAPLAFADDITISVVGPMTGQLATIGDQFKQGAQAAADAINAAGGVNGNQIKLDVQDDQCDPKQAVSVANRIVADGTKFVDGHACSGSSIPASAVYAEAGTLMMSPASSNPELTDAAAKAGWPTIMRLYTRDDAQGAFIGPWIAKKYAGKNVVILHDKSAYGQGVADAVKATMNAGGLKEVDYEGINAGEKDYSALVTKLKELKADVVYFGGYHPEGGLILRQAAEQNVKFQLIMPDSIATPEFWQVAGPAGEGTMFVFPSDPQAKPEAKDAIAKIKAGGFVPEGFTLFSYAVVQAFAEGIKRAGSDDPAKVAEALKNGQPISTVVGDVVFDEKGDLKNASYDINQWHDGKYAPIQP